MKKITCVILLLAMLFTCLPLSLSVSAKKEEPLPDSASLIFNSENSLAMLEATNDLEVSYDENEHAAKLLCNPAGATADPYVLWNVDYTNATKSDYDYILYIFKVPKTVSSKAAKCETVVKMGDGTSESKVISITTSNKGNKYISKQVQLSSLKTLSGKLNSVRFDCFTDCEKGDVMYLESMHLCKDIKVVERIKNSRILMSNSPVQYPEDYSSYYYDTTKYTTPYWKGNIVYNEAVYPIKDKEGNAVFTLMYAPDQIISVCDATFGHMYTEGVDYTVEGNKLTLSEESSINVREYSSLHYEGSGNPGNGYYKGLAKGDGYYELISTAVARDYLNVTYTHSDEWQGPVPKQYSDCLPVTANAIANQGTLNIVYYGDSICGGARSSSNEGIYPYAEHWNQMISSKLRKDYGVNVIDQISSVGGSDSVTMSEPAKVQSFVRDYSPDLVIIEFGTNDAQNYSVDPNSTTDALKLSYTTAVTSIINQIREDNANCEFILVAPFYSNLIDFRKNYFEACRDGAYDIADRFSGVVVADVTEFHEYLLGFKNYADFSGDNLCHPNDFMSRIYTQLCLEAMVPGGVEPIIAHEHVKGESVSTPATCLEAGKTEYKCGVCGKIIDEWTEITDAALGHDYVDHEGKAATTSEAGWEPYQTCSRCNYTTYKAIPVIVARGWQQDADGWYYIKDNGETAKNEWIKDSKGWCYCSANGHIVYNTVLQDSKGFCLVDESGYWVTKAGWKSIDTRWYYVKVDGYLMTNGWMKDSKGWCYLDDEGIMLTRTALKDSKGWCLVDESGYWVTKAGWNMVDGSWYYVQKDGYLVTNGWMKDSKGWCYLNEHGRMLTNTVLKDSKGYCLVDKSGYWVTSQGWKLVNDVWYYVQKGGYLKTNGWMKDSKGWCYLDVDAKMLKDMAIKDSKGWCLLNADGYWVEGVVNYVEITVSYHNELDPGAYRIEDGYIKPLLVR